MNAAYRHGYNEGLAYARQHRRKGLPYLTRGGQIVLCAELFGKANKVNIVNLKAGFKAGYAVGVQEAETIGS